MFGPLLVRKKVLKQTTNTMPKYVVVKPCIVNKERLRKGEELEFPKGHSLAKAYVRFGQLKELAEEPSPGAAPEPKTQPPVKPRQSRATPVEPANKSAGEAGTGGEEQESPV